MATPRKATPNGCPKLPAKEWQFSTVPEEEQRACLYYECGRESPIVKKIVRLWRQYIPAGSSYPFNGSLSEQRRFIKALPITQRESLLLIEFLSTDFRVALVSDSFPQMPWQGIEKQQRSNALKQLRWKSFRPPEPIVPRNLSKASPPGFGYEVDWAYSDDYLKEDFARWLHEHRPVEPDKSKVGRIESSKDLLHHLGRFRLSRYAQKHLGNKLKISAVSEPPQVTDPRNLSRECKKIEMFIHDKTKVLTDHD